MSIITPLIVTRQQNELLVIFDFGWERAAHPWRFTFSILQNKKTVDNETYQLFDLSEETVSIYQ